MENRSIKVVIILTLGLIYCSADSRITRSKTHKAIPVEKPSKVISEAPIIQGPTELTKVTREIVEGKEDVAVEQKFEELDIEEKQKQVMHLIEKTTELFAKTNDLELIFNKITYDPDYKQGEIYVYAFDMEGTCLAHGQFTSLIWKNMYNYRDPHGNPTIQQMIEKAQKGGGWISEEWRSVIKVSYIKKINRGDQPFIIGAGYYPFSKKYTIVALVKGAITLFKKTLETGKPKSVALAEYGYPLGRFIVGDLYIYVISFDGKIIAHGERQGLIGTNSLNYKDEKGTFVNREIIAKLKEAGEDEGIWVDYYSKGAPKRTYAEMVTDDKGKRYFIACGYYPDVDRKAVIDLVDEGHTYLKGHGLALAAEEFNDIDNPEYRYGDLYLFVYNMKGKCLANGANPQLTGQMMYSEQDQDGRYFVREMIEKAKHGGGWLDFKFKNSFMSIYVEEVNVGVGKVVIGSGFYPSSKLSSVTLLAKSGASTLRTAAKPKDAFAEFVDQNGKFIRGDLFVFVFDKNNICLAYGDIHNLLWRNLSYIKTDDGRNLTDVFRTISQRGPSKVLFSVGGKKQIAYVESIKRDDNIFTVGSSFYL